MGHALQVAGVQHRHCFIPVQSRLHGRKDVEVFGADVSTAALAEPLLPPNPPPTHPPFPSPWPAGLVKDVVEQFPEAVVVGSKVCLTFLSNFIHTPFKTQAVKGGDKVGGEARARAAGHACWHAAAAARLPPPPFCCGAAEDVPSCDAVPVRWPQERRSC